MSLKLQAEYGDDLQVLFVEVQGASDNGAAGFALKKKWLGTQAMWTTERPFDLDLDGIPQFGLLSPEGQIVLSGYTMEHSSEIEESIAELVKSARKPRKDLPKEVAKAVVEANAGAQAKALGLLDALLADPAAADAHADAQEVRAEIEAGIDRSLARVSWLLEHGYPQEAQALHTSLTKGLKGLAPRAQALADLTARLESEAVQKELAAAKVLSKAEEKFYVEGPSEKARRSLEKIAESHAGTQVAVRAMELARLGK